MSIEFGILKSPRMLFSPSRDASGPEFQSLNSPRNQGSIQEQLAAAHKGKVIKPVNADLNSTEMQNGQAYDLKGSTTITLGGTQARVILEQQANARESKKTKK